MFYHYFMSIRRSAFSERINEVIASQLSAREARRLQLEEEARRSQFEARQYELRQARQRELRPEIVKLMRANSRATIKLLHENGLAPYSLAARRAGIWPITINQFTMLGWQYGDRANNYGRKSVVLGYTKYGVGLTEDSRLVNFVDLDNSSDQRLVILRLGDTIPYSGRVPFDSIRPELTSHEDQRAVQEWRCILTSLATAAANNSPHPEFTVREVAPKAYNP